MASRTAEEDPWVREKRLEAIDDLFSACEEGDVEEVIRILDSHSNLDANVVYGADKEEKKTKKKGKEREDEVKLELRGLMSADKVVAERSNGLCPLHVATMYGHVTTVNALLERGADVTATDPGGRSALHYACALDTPEEASGMVEILIEAGCDANVADEEGQTPLLWAVNFWKPSLIELLLEKGAQIDVTTNAGHNVLIECVHAGLCTQQPEEETVAMLKLFIEKGIDINSVDKTGNSVLHWSCQFGMVEASRFLLEKGCDSTLKNCDGKTAQDLSEDGVKTCFVTTQES